MDNEEVSTAIKAIRQLLDGYPYGYKPNPAARQDAEKELSIIRENSPKSCEGKIVSVAKWLDIFLLPGEHEEHEFRNVPARVKEIRDDVLRDLAWIEVEVRKSS